MSINSIFIRQITWDSIINIVIELNKELDESHINYDPNSFLPDDKVFKEQFYKMIEQSNDITYSKNHNETCVRYALMKFVYKLDETTMKKFF